jgi:hypothetical protein
MGRMVSDPTSHRIQSACGIRLPQEPGATSSIGTFKFKIANFTPLLGHKRNGGFIIRFEAKIFGSH